MCTYNRCVILAFGLRNRLAVRSPRPRRDGHRHGRSSVFSLQLSSWGRFKPCLCVLNEKVCSIQIQIAWDKLNVSFQDTKIGSV